MTALGGGLKEGALATVRARRERSYDAQVLARPPRLYLHPAGHPPPGPSAGARQAAVGPEQATREGPQPRGGQQTAPCLAVPAATLASKPKGTTMRHDL